LTSEAGSTTTHPISSLTYPLFRVL